MLEKKLVTLAAVAGILVCGGCFFIPSGSKPVPTAPPSAPALRPGLEQIRTIAVTVANTSESQHIAPADLAQAVILRINQFRYPYGISAQQGSDPQTADAVLAIEVLSEVATPPDPASAHPTRWNFEVKTSAKLTAKDGKIIWQETYDDRNITVSLKKGYSADPWKAAKSLGAPQTGCARQLVDRMLYPHN